MNSLTSEAGMLVELRARLPYVEYSAAPRWTLRCSYTEKVNHNRWVKFSKVGVSVEIMGSEVPGWSFWDGGVGSSCWTGIGGVELAVAGVCIELEVVLAASGTELG